MVVLQRVLGSGTSASEPGQGLQLLREPMRAHRGLFVLTLGLLFGGIGLTLVQAWGLRLTFDGLETGRLAMTDRGMIGFGVALVAYALVMVTVNHVRQVFGMQVMMVVRRRAIARLVHATMHFHDQYTTGDLSDRLANDVWSAYQLTAWDLSALISNPLLMLASTVYLWTMSPTLALIILPIGPLLLVVQRFFKHPLYTRSMAVQVTDAELNQATLESFQGVAQIKAFQLESGFAARYRAVVSRLFEAHRRDYVVQAVFAGVTGWVGAVPFLAIVVVGGSLVWRGVFELGTLMAAIQLMNRIVGPFSRIADHLGHVQRGTAALDRIQVATSAPQEASLTTSRPAPEGSAERTSAPDITCSDLQFHYGGQWVLRGLSVRLEARRMTALMGPNGGGKTTLVKLLLGLYPPDSGELTWDGERFEALGMAWIRSHTVYVPQDHFFVVGSVAENLRLIVPEASDTALQQALDQVQLPNDADFMARSVGEGGRELSGGQRLRLSLARALLRDAPLWILDEPTAALDPEGIQSVARLLRELADRRTVVAITHSREVAQLADRTWVVEGGVDRECSKAPAANPGGGTTP